MLLCFWEHTISILVSDEIDANSADILEITVRGKNEEVSRNEVLDEIVELFEFTT